MRPFNKIDVLNTVGEWVEAFNKNALASSDHTWYLGEMLYNGMLYYKKTPPTIGGQEVKSFTNLNIASVSPRVLQFDNMYLYFRNINKILLVDKVTFDLLSLVDENDNQLVLRNEPMFFYLDSELGFRVSQEFKINPNEIMLFRFMIDEHDRFKQLYITAQRFGSNVYDTADEFYQVQGCIPSSAKIANSNLLSIKLSDGTIKRSGIKFDDHNMPDVLRIHETQVPYNLRYITKDNKVNYKAEPVTEICSNKILNYQTKAFTTVPEGKFTAQRILYDIYDGSLIMQYGTGYFDSISQAITQKDNLNYPFPYNNLVYIPLGIMFVKSDADDLSDPDQCIFVQQLNTTVTTADSAFFAEDSYARGRLELITQELNKLNSDLADLTSDFNAHKENKHNPHEVEYGQLYGDPTDSPAFNNWLNSFNTELEAKFIRKDVDDSTDHKLTVGGEFKANSTAVIHGKLTTDSDTRVKGSLTSDGTVTAGSQYITVNNRRVYVGTASGQRPGDYGLF